MSLHKVLKLTAQLAEKQARIKELEGEVAEASKPDLPEGWKWVSVSVPVTKEKGLTLIDGEGMDIIDTVKIRRFMVKYNELEAQLAEADKGYGKRIGSLINRIKELKQQLAEKQARIKGLEGEVAEAVKILDQESAPIWRENCDLYNQWHDKVKSLIRSTRGGEG